MPDSTPEIDKQRLYDRYDEAMRERVRIQNDRLRWQNQLSKQVTHKALDEPLLDDEAMHVDARRHTTVSHTGLGWKELLLLGGPGPARRRAAGLAGAGIGAALLQQYLAPPQTNVPAEAGRRGDAPRHPHRPAIAVRPGTRRVGPLMRR